MENFICKVHVVYQFKIIPMLKGMIMIRFKIENCVTNLKLFC